MNGKKAKLQEPQLRWDNNEFYMLVLYSVLLLCQHVKQKHLQRNQTGLPAEVAGVHTFFTQVEIQIRVDVLIQQ